MAHALRSYGGETATAVAGTPARAVRPAYQAYRILHVGFAALPILAGLDKFFHLLANWDQYLTPLAARVLPVSGHTFMQAVGVIEVAAGVLVAVRPRIGAYVVAGAATNLKTANIAPCGSLTIAKRPVFGMSVGGTMTLPPSSLTLSTLLSASAT